MKLPSAEHPISIDKHPRGIRIRFRGETVAETRDALVLREANYSPVIYVPRADARLEMFKRTSHASHCPYKGDASYFSLTNSGETVENAVWSYEQPFETVEAIKDRLAFYPQHVQVEQTD